MVEVNAELFNEMVTILPFGDGWSHSYMAGMDLTRWKRK
jgi:hypothetical protein